MTELIIDNFAGGGGASHGMHLATGRYPDAAINHDPRALEMYAANHPGARVFCENVWKVAPCSETSRRTEVANSFDKRMRLLIASGLIAGITPTSIRRGCDPATPVFAFLPRGGDGADGRKAGC